MRRPHGYRFVRATVVAWALIGASALVPQSIAAAKNGGKDVRSEPAPSGRNSGSDNSSPGGSGGSGNSSNTSGSSGNSGSTTGGNGESGGSRSGSGDVTKVLEGGSGTRGNNTFEAPVAGSSARGSAIRISDDDRL